LKCNDIILNEHRWKAVDVVGIRHHFEGGIQGAGGKQLLQDMLDQSRQGNWYTVNVRERDGARACNQSQHLAGEGRAEPQRRHGSSLW
jgi:hypothetical protein